MTIKNANSHPFQVEVVDANSDTFYANSHPYKIAVVGGHIGIEARIVDELPEVGETGYIYLILKETTKEGDVYDEYMWVLQRDGETYGWEHIGATSEVTIKLYNELGQNTDGAMTQKATTDALNEKQDKSETNKIVITRENEYLYTVHYNEMPEESNVEGEVFGECSSFVRDGKLYRNLDWSYTNDASFHVITPDFEGMSFTKGLTNTQLDNDKIAQLPYHVVDGVNKHGIMVSTHVLYNDWGATGTGTIPLTKLPFIVLSQVKSMDTLETDLGDTLSNMYVPQAMVDAEYLIQVLVTDGTTTYVLRPGSAPDQSYEAIDITNNPKLTNFRWVDREFVERNANYMQNRPTGVERWNEIDFGMTLEDLRFTEAYENPTRLSEFIGINHTTKDSTDAELKAIYNTAHGEYLNRQRDGKLWQTMHSVVYGSNGMEHLYVQEDWDKDYAYATGNYVDEAIEAIEGEIPELLGTTGQSTTAGMTQKAITDALASAGPTVVQSTGTSTTDVMSQDATTKMIYPTNRKSHIHLGEPGIEGGTYSINIASTAGQVSDNVIRIMTYGGDITGYGAIAIGGSDGYPMGGNVTGVRSIKIGFSDAAFSGDRSIAIGSATGAIAHNGCVNLGSFTPASTANGVVQIGSTNTSFGYNNTKYRLLTGVHDGVNAHDAVTKGQMDTAIADVTINEINSTDWSNLWQ